MNAVVKLDPEIPEALQHYYEPGVIKWDDKDDYWARRIPEFAAQAGVDERWIYKEPVQKHCGPDEIEWLRKFRFKMEAGEGGMVLVRAAETGAVDVIDRMSAMVGLFIRNGVNCRLLTVTQVMDSLFDGGPPIRATCLLCPNMFPSADNLLVSPAMAARMHDFLMQRVQRGLMTIFYSVKIDLLRKQYGADLADFVTKHFTVIEL